MKRNLLGYIDDVISEIQQLEKLHRERYTSALDIEDFDESTRIQGDAHIKIRKLKEWKKTVELFKNDVEQSGIVDNIDVTMKKQEDDKKCNIGKEERREEDELKNNKTEQSEEIEDEKLGDEIVNVQDQRPINQNQDVILSIELFDVIYNFKDGGAVVVKICESMILRKPYIAVKLDTNYMINKLYPHTFSYIENELSGNKKRLSNGLWVKLSTEKHVCLELVHTIVEQCGYSKDVLRVIKSEEVL